MSKENAESVTGKVLDTDSNEVQARLLVWGPQTVDGEMCLIAEPTDFFSTASNGSYEGQERVEVAADDLRIAVPLRRALSAAARAVIAGLADETGDIDRERIEAGPEVWAELRAIFPRSAFDALARRAGEVWVIDPDGGDRTPPTAGRG